METKFKSLSIFEFQSKFPDKESCYEYLAHLKWDAGYNCPRCGNTKYCKGIKDYDRQCTRCSYLESPTAGTLFHKVKFSLHKAFWIIYYLSTGKKGISSTELSRKLQLRQKTCWLFKQKAMQAMESRNIHPLEGEVEIEIFEIGHEIGAVNSGKVKKKQIAIAIEKKTKGISRMYAYHIGKTRKTCLTKFINTKISKEAQVKCSRKIPIEKLNDSNPKLSRKELKKGKKFEKINRAIHGFKSWFSGIHGHAKHLQYYINEYCYRYNRHLMKAEIFEDLIIRMVRHKPMPYFEIVNYAPNSMSH